MSTYAITVAGVTKYAKLDSLRISETANGRNTLSFSIVSNDGSFRPAIGAEILISEDGTRIFGGLVDTGNETGEGGIGWASILNNITAQDFNSYADRRFVYSLKIVAGKLKAAIEAIMPYLTPYGVSLDAGQVDGPDLPEINIEWQRVSDVLTQFSDLSQGYIWDISYSKVLSMKLPASNLAPFNLTADDGNVIGDFTVEYGMGDYANRVIVRFTEGAISAWAHIVPSGAINNGEKITIGSIEYTWQTNLVNEENNVKIGATIPASLENLRLALEAEEGGAGEGTAWGAGTNKNSAAYGVTYRSGWFTAIAREGGDQGNSIAVNETMTNAHWIWEGNQPTSSLLGGKNEALTNWVEANNDTEQGTQGIWEKIIEAPEIRDYGAAQAKADAEIQVSVLSRTFKRGKYTTEEKGIHPGQKQTITLPARALSGDYIVTDVEIMESSNWVRRTVSVQGGAILANRWIDDAKRALGGGGTSGSSGAFVIIGAAPGGGGGGGGTTVINATAPIYFGGGEDIRTRVTTASTWYRGRNGGEVILDSYKLPTTIDMSLLMIADAVTGGNAQCRVVAGSGDWSNQTVVSGTVTPVTDGANWVWQNVVITPRVGYWAYRIEMSSSVNNSDVGFRAYLLW